jgi:hypothetical protein
MPTHQPSSRSSADAHCRNDAINVRVPQFQWHYYAIVKEKSTSTGAFELLADPHWRHFPG